MSKLTARYKEGLFIALFSASLFLFLAFICSFCLADIFYINWRAFIECLKDSETLFAIKLSFSTAGLTTLIAIFIGIPAAYALSRFRLPAGSLIDTVLDLPIVLPPPVVGISLLVLFQTPLGEWIEKGLGIEIVYTQRGIIIAQFAIAASFGIRALKATFDGINPRFEHIARSLGCSRFQAFFKVTLPLAKTGLIAGAIMTWARAIAEFGPVLFFCGATRFKTEVMPVAMFLNWSIGNIEMGITLAIIMMCTSLVTLLAFKKLGGKGYLW